jgi:hypothetical protein
MLWLFYKQKIQSRAKVEKISDHQSDNHTRTITFLITKNNKMKNLIDRLMKDYSDLTFIQYRIKATEMLSETLDNIDERRDRIQADLFYLRE